MSIKYSHRRQRRYDRERAAEEKEWKSKAGPVTVKYLPGFEPKEQKPK